MTDPKLLKSRDEIWADILQGVDDSVRPFVESFREAVIDLASNYNFQKAVEAAAQAHRELEAMNKDEAAE